MRKNPPIPKKRYAWKDNSFLFSKSNWQKSERYPSDIQSIDYSIKQQGRRRDMFTGRLRGKEVMDNQSLTEG